MRIHRGLDRVETAAFRSPTVTLGFFDGVHSGHRVLLGRAREMAARLGGDLVVVTFDIHPRAVTTGRSPPLITSLPHRLVLLEREGVTAAVVLEFTAELRQVPAERFVEEILVDRIGARGVVLGYDSHFGHHRSGDFELVHTLLTPRGIPVERTDAVTMPDGEVVSSSAIRAAVARSDLAAAARMLGRPPALYGRVVRGEGRGHGLGFPTANLDLEGELRPNRGVFGGAVEIDGRVYPAAVNIGGRPTFHPEGDREDTVEVHVLDFTGDLYGGALEVVLLGRIRDERKFDGADALRTRIAVDVATLRARIAAGDWRLPAPTPVRPRS